VKDNMIHLVEDVYALQMFSEEESLQILDIFLKQENWQPARITVDGDNYSLRSDIRQGELIDLKTTPIPELDPYISKIRKICYECKDMFGIEDDIRFDLLQIHKNKPGSFFNWHLDSSEKRLGKKRRAFVCLVYVNGSKDFTGGNTTFRVNKELFPVEPKPGLAAIFNSLTMKHRGEKVETGIKYCIHCNIGWKNWKKK